MESNGLGKRFTGIRLLLAGLLVGMAAGGYTAYGWLASPTNSRYRFLSPATPWQSAPPVVLATGEIERLTREVDRLVSANLDRLGIEPAPPATDEVFVRRVYLDVVGRIPSYNETLSFLQSSDADKRKELIDRLLDSDGYACNFFNFWADLLRLLSRTGHCWAGAEYGEWLKQSLKSNKPYDQFVYELLTASGRPHQNGAVGYRLRDQGMLADNVSNTMQLFLGARVQCAECHDDPAGSISQLQFYELASFFAQAFGSRGRRPLSRAWVIEERLAETIGDEPTAYESDRRHAVTTALWSVSDRLKPFELPDNYQYSDAKTGSVVEPAVPFGKPVKIGPNQTHREAFARWVVDPDNSRFSQVIANRLWNKVMGAGLTEPVDDVENTAASNAELLAFLADTMRQVGFDMKQFLRIILRTETYQRAALRQDTPLDQPHHFQGRLLRRMSAEQIWDSLVSLAVPDIDQRRGFGSAIINSREKVERIRLMRPFEFARWLDEPLLLDEAERRRHPAHVAPFVVPKDVVEGNYELWTWDMTGAVDPRWRDFPRTLVRACELESPAPADHFLRILGQSDREAIEGASTSATVAQTLVLLNDEIHQHLWRPKSVLARDVAAADSSEEKINVLYLAALSREPGRDELELAKNMIVQYGADGTKMVAWALINSSEFLFVQ